MYAVVWLCLWVTVRHDRPGSNKSIGRSAVVSIFLFFHCTRLSSFFFFTNWGYRYGHDTERDVLYYDDITVLGSNGYGVSFFSFFWLQVLMPTGRVGEELDKTLRRLHRREGQKGLGKINRFRPDEAMISYGDSKGDG